MSNGMFSVINRSKRKYELIKNNPELKKIKLNYEKKYQQNYNQKPDVKLKKLEYAKEIQQIRREMGLCTRCGKDRENMEKVTCYSCREHQRIDYLRKKKIRSKKNE